MSYAHFASPARPMSSDSHSAIAAHRGDVTTMQAASYVRLQETKRAEKLQSHAPSHRTAGTTSLPVVLTRIGQA